MIFHTIDKNKDQNRFRARIKIETKLSNSYNDKFLIKRYKYICLLSLIPQQIIEYINATTHNGGA